MSEKVRMRLIAVVKVLRTMGDITGESPKVRTRQSRGTVPIARKYQGKE